MSGTVRIRHAADGLVVIAPTGAPTVLDAVAGIDVAVLEVLGGHLSWRVLDGESVPAAVLDDAGLAQEWLWAVYGEAVALAVDAGVDRDLDTAPELPELAAKTRRLGYAHWASRWWPASVIDGIAPLDERLLRDEIAALTRDCELIVAGADAAADTDERSPAVVPEVRARAQDYALAAGPATTPPPGALILASGTGGWDWCGCPPGLLDASDRAVSWQVLRAAGATTLLVRAVAAPGSTGEVPAHLQPHALVRTATGTAETPLARDGDTWLAELTPPDDVTTGVTITIAVPGVGTGAPDDPALRRAIRALAIDRLRRAVHSTDELLDAEIAAAASDSDY